jgi:hypothetical protein
MSYVLAFLLAAVVCLWASTYYSRRRSSALTSDDLETMRIRASLIPPSYAGYGKLRAEMIDKLHESVYVDAEESLYWESLIWRRMYRSNPNPDNKAQCEFHFDKLAHLHAQWQLNTPELEGLNKRMRDCRECLFILQYGTPEEVRKVIADAKGMGWGKE